MSRRLQNLSMNYPKNLPVQSRPANILNGEITFAMLPYIATSAVKYGEILGGGTEPSQTAVMIEPGGVDRACEWRRINGFGPLHSMAANYDWIGTLGHRDFIICIQMGHFRNFNEHYRGHYRVGGNRAFHTSFSAIPNAKEKAEAGTRTRTRTRTMKFPSSYALQNLVENRDGFVPPNFIVMTQFNDSTDLWRG